MTVLKIVNASEEVTLGDIPSGIPRCDQRFVLPKHRIVRDRWAAGH
ncbi:hypothetical protein [Pendulispora rubella]